jgi:hypothetical protein
MAEKVNPVTGKSDAALPESPLVGSSYVTTAVTGTSYGHVGVSGQSLAAPVPAGGDVVKAPVLSDGVLGQGKNGVHGVNGAGSGITVASGAGVFGESDASYGVYGASKTGQAGYFNGGVTVTGAINAAGVTVTGTFKVSQISASDITLTGNITAADVILSGADCAEEFDVMHTADLDPGCVVIFNEGGALSASTKAYDKQVAGVISGAGAYRPGVILDRRISDRPRAAVALVGKVFCKVDADYGPIEIGDLLTTSPTAGTAMKASDPSRAFGAVIGKALAHHSAGKGLIPILVTLQ